LTNYDKEIDDWQSSLGSDIDWQTLPEAECWVVARTTVKALLIGSQEGKVVDAIIPPLREFRVKLNAANPADVFLYCSRGAKRIRNYLAYATESPIPIGFKMMAKTLLLPQAYDSRDFLYPPQLAFGDTTREQWSKSLDRSYDLTTELLGKVVPDSYHDRAINHLGEAVWSTDVEDSFLRCWRALETIADWDFLNAKETYESMFEDKIRPYLDEEEAKRISIKSGRIDKLHRVLVTYRLRASSTHDEVIKGFWGLRHAIAHGEVNQEKYKAILLKRPEIFRLAHDIVASAVAGSSVASSGDRP
jgi:hypothetical protein